MFYRSLSDLSRTIAQHSAKIPSDVDLIVGVPRSGLLAANMLALHLNLRVADFDGFLAGRTLSTGRRIVAETGTSQHALVLDDSISTGSQMLEIRKKLDECDLACRVTTAAVYVAPDRAELVDLNFELLGNPRIFEWNLMNHYLLESACVDIDGVLCLDPTEKQNDDACEYAAFLADAPRLYRPACKVGWLVTSRLEKYRPATELWLASHGIQYGELIMLDLPSKEARQASQAHSSFKAKVYSRTPSSIFIESDDVQASEIASRSGKPVLSLATHRMYYPSAREMVSAKVARSPWTLGQKARRVGGLAIRRLFKLPNYPIHTPK